MRRREFFGLIGGAAVAWPVVARAQQAAMPVIGYLSARSAEVDGPMLAAFRRGLFETGYVEVATFESKSGLPMGSTTACQPLWTI